MKSNAKLYRRLSRRETHSSRALVSIILAVLIILLFVYAGIEIVLNMLGQRALVASPTQVSDAIGDATSYPTGSVLAVGIVAVILGVVVIVVGVTGGRRARHLVVDDRAVVVVDNEVIASALARHAAHAGNIDPGNTLVTVTHRNARVGLIPTSGQPLDREVVLAAVTEQLAGVEYRPALKPEVRISSHGKVGA